MDRRGSDLSSSGGSRFYDDVLKGNVYKDIVKILLEKSGYTVYPYGYESTYSHIISKLNKNTRNSRTVRRIRSSPDLLIYDELRNDLMLVEVKMRIHFPPRIAPRLIENYKEFWNDLILVVIVPEGNVFYAQRISELETREAYYRINDFEEFQEVFTRVKAEGLSHFRKKALENMKGHRTEK